MIHYGISNGQSQFNRLQQANRKKFLKVASITNTCNYELCILLITRQLTFKYLFT